MRNVYNSLLGNVSSNIDRSGSVQIMTMVKNTGVCDT
jgi:hypothetical protein